MALLFSPFDLKGKTIKNRVVLPPMVCFYPDSANDGFVQPRNVAHYAAIAKGGCGTVIVEATCVSETGKLHPCQLGVWDDKFIEGLAAIATAIHAEGALALVQIHHAGLKTIPNPGIEQELWAPSDYSHKDKTARAMTTAEIEQVIEQFAQAAKRLEAAGFDGVEIHGCHAYLISQFMSPSVNLRTDVYGQDKALLGKQVIEAVKKATGSGFIVGIRTSGNDPDMAASIAYAQAFEQAGADYLHVSTGFVSSKPADMTFDDNSPVNWIAQMAGEIKKHVSVPVITVNGIRTPEQAESALEQGIGDLAAIGKAHLVDAEWANKGQQGVAIKPCLNCPSCQTFKNREACRALQA